MNSWKQFALTVLALVAVLAGYEYYRHGQDVKIDAQLEQLHQQSEALSQQAGNLADTVARERAEAEATKARYVGAAYLVEGLTVAANVKAMVTEFYMTNGAWPRSNAEAGVEPADTFRGQALKRLELTPGVITLTYNGKTGIDGGQIRLIGDASHPQMGVRWRCVTSSYPDITSSMPQCEYRQPAARGDS